MSLPIGINYPPMEAQTAMRIPEGPEWQFEPKWDGFRALVFRDGDDIQFQSKSGQSLGRYFPELVDVVARLKPQSFVLDGEIIIPEDGGLAFNKLLQRIHPAASRIAKLAKETPAELVVFDLLVNDKGESLVEFPLRERKKALDEFAKKYLNDNQSIHVSPYTSNVEEAKSWFHEMAGGLDGIVAKRLDLPYASGTREGMRKIKNLRTADCVVGGFRYAAKGRYVGSLLLGLYDDAGLLHHVGFMSGIAVSERETLTKRLEEHIGPPGFTGNAPGGPSRWSTERSTQWEPLKPVLVVEVQYDHFTGGRFRHGTRLLRWRPDKRPDQCTMKQVERESRSPLNLLKRK
jgi:ATP-dependent DNA ligase